MTYKGWYVINQPTNHLDANYSETGKLIYLYKSLAENNWEPVSSLFRAEAFQWTVWHLVNSSRLREPSPRP